MAGGHKIIPRWGQPLTGIIATIIFTAVAWVCWFIFSNPTDGVYKLYEHPFLVFLAWMILFGLWQHIIFGDWPFQNLKPLSRGIAMTVTNLVGVYFVIYGVFHNFLGKIIFPLWSPETLTEIMKGAFEKGGAAALPAGFQKGIEGTVWTPEIHEHILELARDFSGSAITMVVLIGFFTYAFWSIIFQKWPFAGKLTQPALGLAEFGITTSFTMLFYGLLIFPFFGNTLLAGTFVSNLPWWKAMEGNAHLNYVVGIYEWAIVWLFMTANVWEGKPWHLIPKQPWRGIVAFFSIFIIAFLSMKVCLAGMEAYWGPVVDGVKDGIQSQNWRYYNSASMAGFTLFPFLIWNHFFDNWPKQYGEVAGWIIRTVGVLAAAAVLGFCYYQISPAFLGLSDQLGSTNAADALKFNKPLVWLFWWIIPLLFTDWFMHKWPFYVEEHESHSVSPGKDHAA